MIFSSNATFSPCTHSLPFPLSLDTTPTYPSFFAPGYSGFLAPAMFLRGGGALILGCCWP